MTMIISLFQRVGDNDGPAPRLKRRWLSPCQKVIKYGLRTRTLRREAVSLLIRLGKPAIRFRGRTEGVRTRAWITQLSDIFYQLLGYQA